MAFLAKTELQKVLKVVTDTSPFGLVDRSCDGHVTFVHRPCTLGINIGVQSALPLESIALSEVA